jgi:MerR family Zn(II)-responsive transcriptional regulator of zntA
VVIDAILLSLGVDMLTVSELSKEVEMTSDAVRHYVRIGLLFPSRDPVNGYKLFSREDIKKAKFIGKAKSLGFTLQDIRTIFEHSNTGETPCLAVRNMIQQHIDNNRVRLAELNKIQQRMETAVQKWSAMPDGTPDGKAICHLIESIS